MRQTTHWEKRPLAAPTKGRPPALNRAIHPNLSTVPFNLQMSDFKHTRPTEHASDTVVTTNGPASPINLSNGKPIPSTMPLRSANRSNSTRTILLTGGAGFIGSHVVELLLERYATYRLIVLDKLDYCAAIENISSHFGKRDNLVWCRGDIRSKCLVDYVLRSENVDTIMHFAASTHVDNSFHSSIEFTSNNVVGTHVLLESAREYGAIHRFIHVSTDEVYGGETDFEKEDSMLAPTNPYACSKAAAELICRGYANSFRMPIIITRGNNVYGPRQYPDKLVAKTCCLLHKGRDAFIHGKGLHKRSYVYVTDMAEAFDTVLHHGKIGGVYNVGCDIERTNLNVVRNIVTACGLADPSDANAHIQFVKDREVNDQHYSIDSSKLRALGWSERVSWTEGIDRTVKWYANEQNLKRWGDFNRGLVAHPSRQAEEVGDFY